MGWRAMDRRRAVVNAVMNLWVPLSARNFLTSWGPVSFSERSLFDGVNRFIFFYSLPAALFFFFLSFHVPCLALPSQASSPMSRSVTSPARTVQTICNYDSIININLHNGNLQMLQGERGEFQDLLLFLIEQELSCQLLADFSWLKEISCNWF
jgi:hypothetical protein